MRSRGQLVPGDDHATLTFRRVYHHAPQLVWQAITTPEGLSKWLLCSYARIDPRAGGAIEMVSGPRDYRSTGTILVWDPPRVFEYEWNVEPLPEMPQGEHAIFRYELVARGDSTEMTVTYSRLTNHTARGFLPGLHAFLDRLEAQLDSTELPDWNERFVRLQAEYPEWSGHAPTAGE